MRYFCSDMPYPSTWVETDCDERKTIDRYLENRIRVHDADNCGSQTYYFAFSSGRYFKLEYTWWIVATEDMWLDDESQITEVAEDQCEGLCKDRNWFRLCKCVS